MAVGIDEVMHMIPEETRRRGTMYGAASVLIKATHEAGIAPLRDPWYSMPYPGINANNMQRAGIRA